MLGPGSAESHIDLGIIALLQSNRPEAAGYGPSPGRSATGEATVARSLDIVMDRVDLTDIADRTVYIPGFCSPRAPEVARRADAAYAAALLAERVVSAHGRIALDRRDAAYVCFPWIQVLGGITTYREYRTYGYPLYLHDENQRPAWVLVFLYDRERRRLSLLEGDRTWQVRVESYFLGIFRYEWMLGF